MQEVPNVHSSGECMVCPGLEAAADFAPNSIVTLMGGIRKSPIAVRCCTLRALSLDLSNYLSIDLSLSRSSYACCVVG
jgi:hypothetical protein